MINRPTRIFIKTNSATISNGRFVLIDDNKAIPKMLIFKDSINKLSDFLIYGQQSRQKSIKCLFLDHRGLYVTDLNTDFSYTKNIKLENLTTYHKGIDFERECVF
jgi:phage repressor protein C with HTH and peptisase S24 domain